MDFFKILVTYTARNEQEYIYVISKLKIKYNICIQTQNYK